ncbi:MAG: hypothetical protein ACKVZH_07570 [Blastocatellia bacterium]
MQNSSKVITADAELVTRTISNPITIKEKVMPRPKGSGNRSELVQLAIVGIEAQIQKLQSEIEALNDKRKELVKGGSASAAAPTAKNVAVAPKKKRVVSAATKKRLKEAAKARWAKARAEKEGA